jgi:hypothetical protein
LRAPPPGGGKAGFLLGGGGSPSNLFSPHPAEMSLISHDGRGQEDLWNFYGEKGGHRPPIPSKRNTVYVSPLQPLRWRRSSFPN